MSMKERPNYQVYHLGQGINPKLIEGNLPDLFEEQKTGEQLKREYEEYKRERKVFPIPFNIGHLIQIVRKK